MFWRIGFPSSSSGKVNFKSEKHFRSKFWNIWNNACSKFGMTILLERFESNFEAPWNLTSRRTSHDDRISSIVPLKSITSQANVWETVGNRCFDLKAHRLYWKYIRILGTMTSQRLTINHWTGQQTPALFRSTNSARFNSQVGHIRCIRAAWSRRDRWPFEKLLISGQCPWSQWVTGYVQLRRWLILTSHQGY